MISNVTRIFCHLKEFKFATYDNFSTAKEMALMAFNNHVHFHESNPATTGKSKKDRKSDGNLVNNNLSVLVINCDKYTTLRYTVHVRC